MRVRVCKKATPQSDIPLESNCKRYPDNDPAGNYKPTGILQEYGEGVSPRMYFGLMTGSYAKNTNGGVLRRNMGKPANGATPADDMSKEIDPATGTFITAFEGIIATFNRLHATGFSASNATNVYAYETAYAGQNCGWLTTGPLDRRQMPDVGQPHRRDHVRKLALLCGSAVWPALRHRERPGRRRTTPGWRPASCDLGKSLRQSASHLREAFSDGYFGHQPHLRHGSVAGWRDGVREFRQHRSARSQCVLARPDYLGQRIRRRRNR